MQVADGRPGEIVHRTFCKYTGKQSQNHFTSTLYDKDHKKPLDNLKTYHRIYEIENSSNFAITIMLN